jgi:hypothetical protein
MFGKSHTLEAKKKMIEKNSNMGNWNVYQGYFDDIFWQGTWELSYIIYCIENKIKIKRYDIDPIEYLDGEKIRHFFPDFIIEENKIVEIKGKFKNEKLNLPFVGKRYFNFLRSTGIGYSIETDSKMAIYKEDKIEIDFK